MRIAYVGNFKLPWCTEVHVAESLQTLGHHVLTLQENTVNFAALPRLLRARRCELLLWTRTWSTPADVALDALAQLRMSGIPSVSYHLDRWLGLEREYQLESEPFFRTDLVVSPDGTDEEAWAKRGINHLWLPPGVLERECMPVAPDPGRFPHEVVFVGTQPYPHPAWAPTRAQMLEGLAARYGDRFHIWPEDRGHPIRGRALATLYASAKVVVGDSCLVPPVSAYWSDRVPETLGRGGFLVHPYVEGIDEWYPELPTFPPGDVGALFELVDRWLHSEDDARREVAERQRQLVLARDTYRHRLATVIEHVEKMTGRGGGALAHAAGLVHVIHERSRTKASFELAQGGSDGVAVREVFVDDTYQLTREQVRGGIVVDVGANVGAFSVLAAKLGAVKVLAFEPHPASMARLVANVERNGVGGIVWPEQAAILDDAGKVLIEGDGGGAHVGRGDVALPADHDPAMYVEARSLDEVLQGVDEVALLKIDTEGSEYRIVDGCAPSTLAKVRRLVMEFHGPGMPHLTHLDPAEWGPMVAKLAEQGRVRTFGRPSVGGLLWWERY